MTSLPSRECDIESIGLETMRRGQWHIRVSRTRRNRRVSRVQPVAPRKYEIFKSLVNQWHRDTWFKSSISKRISHIAYLKIIGLGMEAVPWIIQELRDDPDYWFAALEAITRDDPAPNAKNMSELRDAWLEWEKNRIAR